MRVCIIDDDKNCADQLSKMLESQNDVELVNVSNDGQKGLDKVRELLPDAVFLDVEMPGVSGIDLLAEMPAGVHVVIYTAHGKYMINALRGHAFDFLHKPVQQEEFEEVMTRLRTDLQEHAQADAAASKGATDDEHFIAYTSTDDFVILRVRDIGAFVFNSEMRCWEVLATDRPNPVRLRRAMKAKDILGWSDSFVQVHQSYIVNITYLAEVADNVCHLLPPFDNIESIRMGRSYRSKFMKRYKNL